MNNTNHAQCEVRIEWHSTDAAHCERHFFDRVNFRRDHFPCFMGDNLGNATLGEWVTETLHRGDMIDAYSERLVYKLERHRIAIQHPSSLPITLRRGRFYPRNIITGIPGVNSSELMPLRIVAIDEDTITVDLNHPLAGKQIKLGIRACAWLPVQEERGGHCNDIVLDTLMQGPGMQADNGTHSTDFRSPAYFQRADERDDANRYASPDFTALVDTTAEQHLQSLYAQHLRPGMQVMDLMAGHDSHVPDMDDLDITGLGLNQEELDANPKLSRRVVHDINQTPLLPFENDSLDAAIYSLSIEYLTQPQALFNEVARTCKPGAPFIITFSETWVASKAIAQWGEMHAFERMGLVLDYFRQTNQFDNLHTESFREWPRPADDPEHEQNLFSDSIYAVWGLVK